MQSKKKRLIIGSILFIAMCFAAVKMNVLPAVSAKVNDMVSDTKTIQYIEDGPYHEIISPGAVVSPDLKYLASCKGTKEFVVQDLSTGVNTTYPTVEKIYQLKYSPNSVYLAAGRNILNMQTGKVTTLATDAEIRSSFDHITFSTNSEQLAFVNEEPVASPRPAFIEVWDIQKEVLVQKLPNNRLVYQMVFSPDGRYLSSAGSEISLWDIQVGKCIKTLVTDSLPVDNELKWHIDYQSIAYSPDGKHLAAVLRDNYSSKGEHKELKKEVIEIWDTEQGVVTQTWNSTRNIEKLQYSADGQYLASALNIHKSDLAREAIWIWDVKSETVIKKLGQYPDYSVLQMDYSADGNYLSASGEQNVKIWKIK